MPRNHPTFRRAAAACGPPAGRFVADQSTRPPAGRFVADQSTRFSLQSLQSGGTIDADVAMLRGRSVLVLAARQLPALLALAQLDGIARRIVLAPPDLAPEHLPAVIAEAEVELVVTDGALAPPPCDLPIFGCGTEIARPGASLDGDLETEWLLFTSGTTGRPKLVVHTLASLAGPLNDRVGTGAGTVWSTFYDIRRYGGMAIMLRAMLGGGSLVLSDPRETLADFLGRAGAAGVTHISGTPSHWRRALMSPALGQIAPGYVRLSGEVADQAILNHLRNAFPNAAIAHAFASTEAGVGFDVTDGQAGFPAALIDRPGGAVQLRVQDGSLGIRSPRTAVRYAHADGGIAGADGFVDTGDMLERRGERYYFVGRREGLINVGGQKVHPEEVEAVVNLHPLVRMSRVRGRANPITGAIVIADVVLRDPTEPAPLDFATIRAEILQSCRQALPPHKVPAMLNRVASLELSASGKLRRVA